ncbi:MAG TPA: hypothetical protein VHK69_04235, partial [Chitinophagaceae bacterium]|nr:hypothetical protein [Chitinophagaceae bacterium]
MNKNKYLMVLLAVLISGLSAHGQVYKTVADTAQLNKEFTEVSNDIATLTAKLTVARNNLPGVRTKAESADTEARTAADNNSTHAQKATGTSVKEARKAKRIAKKAYREAKDAREANNDVSDQNERIAELTGQLARKQERLDQLTAMRTAILAGT